MHRVAQTVRISWTQMFKALPLAYSLGVLCIVLHTNVTTAFHLQSGLQLLTGTPSTAEIPAVPEHYEGPAHLKNVLKWKTLEKRRRYIEVLERGGAREQLPPKKELPPLPALPAAANSTAHPATANDVLRQQRCSLMLTSACTGWWAQSSIPMKPYPQGSKECPNKCNGQGTCNYDIGECQCTAGFAGKDCSEPVKRPCSYRLRSPMDPVGQQIGEADWRQGGWTASRCAGTCDDIMGLCYCGLNSTYARIPAPAGSPWGTPPVKRGLPLMVPCQPRDDPTGAHVGWGHMQFSQLYGPRSWCETPREAPHCPCALENTHGQTCEIISDSWCPNQCNARGHCVLGFCKCHEGWYGTACDKLKQGTPYTPAVGPEHIKSVWREPPHSKQPVDHTAHRKRPFIYVYDLPSVYNVGMVQIKNNKMACNWRRFSEHNYTEVSHGGYMLETYLHEVLLTSTHRTLDPEEADFFYVPVYYASCYAWPILGWSDGPWFHKVPDPQNRPLQAAHMYLGAKRWLQQAYPYWNRSQGRDHIFLTAHDEGACFLPSEIYNTAIILTHWGRTDEDHESGTAYPADNYTQPLGPGWDKLYRGEDWRDVYRNPDGRPHKCYTPGKDLVVPAFADPYSLRASPLLGAVPLERDILFYFKGDVGLSRLWWYSRGIRQTLFRLALEDDWWGKYRMVMVDRGMLHDDYSTSLARSKFCLVAPGDGWSARAEAAILHGCIPVVIQDEVEMIFHDLLDWSEFGVRVAQKDIYDLPKILLAFTEEEVRAKQAALAKVWHRFAYGTGPWHRRELPRVYSQSPDKEADKKYAGHVLAPLSKYPVMNDAFHTILQWLYGRLRDKAKRTQDTQAALL